jgi:hypothetical protein
VSREPCAVQRPHSSTQSCCWISRWTIHAGPSDRCGSLKLRLPADLWWQTP